MLLQIMKEFGFYINFEKSALHPFRRIHYLGFINDSEQFKLFLPEEILFKIFYIVTTFDWESNTGHLHH